MGTVGQYLGQKGPVINQHDVTHDYRERYPFGHPDRLTFERYLDEGQPDESFPEWKARILGGGKP